MCDINLSERRSRELKERSSSVRNIKSGRDHRNEDYFGSSHKLDAGHLASKQSRQYSKAEYELSEIKNQSKNLNQNTEYIKSLYKKYLGKENNPAKSERKPKADTGIVRNLFGKEAKAPRASENRLKDNGVAIKSNQTQESYFKANEQSTEPAAYCNSKYTLSKNKSVVSVELPCKKSLSNEQSGSNFYTQMMNESYLQLLGNPRSSLVLCMKAICRAKKIALEKY